MTADVLSKTHVRLAVSALTMNQTYCAEARELLRKWKSVARNAHIKGKSVGPPVRSSAEEITPLEEMECQLADNGDDDAEKENGHEQLETKGEEYWENYVKAAFPKCNRKDGETWSECCERLKAEREQKRAAITSRIQQGIVAREAAMRRAVLIDAIPPNSYLKGKAGERGEAVSANFRTVRGIAAPSSSCRKQKKEVAPLMKKTLKMLGIKQKRAGH
ncbi:unnamed protein product [Gongylonema pulchrum]|uniref:TFIIS N-terminal domain-containing protein n=1 Tax=Gongylonema pulchrum TaxID=637853 RepID=A0A183ES28_9BILA|nr:unnamed protein product [Gongylonema pulchrum]